MGIGLGIFLIVVGAILAFAVRDSIEAVDLTMVGYICLAAGVVALIAAIIMNAQRNRTSHHEVVERRDTTTPVTVVENRETYPPAGQ
ncbi:DUF6458 family protein [Sanguibacter suarezii]|uniref:DUF6458 family protein n=1 Tax=Sanguibacter suarezii TaxID=60921 RepID=UPI000831F522|nr:DUF6458 family protein [Sanguibacter suarezii]